MTTPAINAHYTQEFLWDFAVNGGAATAHDLGDLPLGAVVTDIGYVCEAAITSAGSGATVILGTTDDDNGFIASLDAENVFTLLATKSQKSAANQPQVNDAASRDVVLTIGGEAATAGKVRFLISYYLPSNVVISE